MKVKREISDTYLFEAGDECYYRITPKRVEECIVDIPQAQWETTVFIRFKNGLVISVCKDHLILKSAMPKF